MKQVELIFRVICLNKFYPIKNRPITQTIEFYLRNVKKIGVSIDLLPDGYYIYFKDTESFKKFLEIGKKYMDFTNQTGDSALKSDGKMDDKLDKKLMIIIATNNSNSKEKDLLSLFLEIIPTSKYLSLKLMKVKNQIKLFPNAKYFVKMTTLKRDFIIATMKNYYSAIKDKFSKK